MLTLGIAFLLACGFAAAKLCQFARLPSVTGYVLAGLLLGPSGFDIIAEERIGDDLDHFTQIALMLIAFGIGEHIEVRKLKKHAKSLFAVGISETTGAFLVVSLSVFTLVSLSDFQTGHWTVKDFLALSILLGAFAVATAPAATLLILREVKARGPLTSTLMAIIAIDNGIAIMTFGLAVSISHQIIGHASEPFYIALLFSLLEIVQSLALGLATGYVLRLLVIKLKSSAEIMTAGLALLLLCGEIAISFSLSPLLAGMAAGFILVNKADKDVRAFRALNQFEPPIYVLFFTLAGTHLDIEGLGAAGIVGIVYFFGRIGGKIAGATLGATFAGADKNVRRYLGFTLLPQAGVAIGLLFLISSMETLAKYTIIITPVVLAGIFFSELIGPLSARIALGLAGEDNTGKQAGKASAEIEKNDISQCEKNIEIVPWTWRRLSPSANSKGVVVFGADNNTTVRGLARIATIIAHYLSGRPMSVRVDSSVSFLDKEAFSIETDEVSRMGYTLLTEHVPDKSVASGLVAAAEYHRAKAVVLGVPADSENSNIHGIMKDVVHNVLCPVVVVRLCGPLHTERILVPVTDMEDLEAAYPAICALSSVGEHRIRLLYMMSSTAERKEIRQKKIEISAWLNSQNEPLSIRIKAVPTDSRVNIICREAREYDIVVFGGEQINGVSRFFFGSLPDSVAESLRKPMIVVYNSGKYNLLDKKENLITPLSHQVSS
jgi:Kef-type K+ transport system membrane component KefB/nucleotide-binding universal stress UspA family protein